MDPSIFFSRNEQMKAKGEGCFHIFETAWIYWVGVAEMSFCSSGHRLIAISRRPTACSGGVIKLLLWL